MNPSVSNNLPKAVPHALLADYTTFRLGGPCRYLLECQTPQEVQQSVAHLAAEKTPFVLIGGGSNLVFSDHGLDAVVIRYVSPSPIIERSNDDVTVSGGTSLDALALYAVDEGLEGLNYTTGIPGTVGGAVVGNAGAWGKQVGDVLKSALVMDKQGKTKTVGPDYFAFTYRHSRLKETNEIILSVTFALTPGDQVKLAVERADILKLRAEKHPDMNAYPCAGSFFRNVEPTSKAERRQAAGWFLEEAGGKNLKVGGAQIFDKHANIIVKGPGCSAQNVHDLHLRMIAIVREKFGFDLNREVRFAGKFANAPKADERGFW